ncbi:hypothetical protein ABD86_01685 [Paenibacillus alvei]|nr:hypothetical protein [Paenibacillus alvei]MBG9742706.1 hypothetical protein [Paenibacillus alvei]
MEEGMKEAIDSGALDMVEDNPSCLLPCLIRLVSLLPSSLFHTRGSRAIAFSTIYVNMLKATALNACMHEAG